MSSTLFLRCMKILMNFTRTFVDDFFTVAFQIIVYTSHLLSCTDFNGYRIIYKSCSMLSYHTMHCWHRWSEYYFDQQSPPMSNNLLLFGCYTWQSNYNGEVSIWRITQLTITKNLQSASEHWCHGLGNNTILYLLHSYTFSSSREQHLLSL